MILEVSFRDVEKNEFIEKLIREKANKLEQVCNELISCRVAVEKPQEHQRTGNPFRVRIDMTVPGKEFVATRESSKGEMHSVLSRIVRDAFDAARRQLREYKKKQQGKVKVHPEQETVALVVKLFRDKGYGFLKTPEGVELYFHRHSILHDDFDRLEIGTAVRYVMEAGEKGPQASTVQIVDKPGARLSKIKEAEVEPPLGWES